MRLNQFLARAGLGSRRACEDLIKEGRVLINGQRISQLATRVEERDAVLVDGKRVQPERGVTAMLHKPAGYLCSTAPEGGAKTIFDLLPREWPRVFYVGRLDLESEGLLIVTNDGALSQKLTHPSQKLAKVYEVALDHEFDFAMADKLKKGMPLPGAMEHPRPGEPAPFGRMDEIHRLGARVVKVVLTQGLKRQIRLMFENVGYKVRRLVRTQIGGLVLGDLPPGKWKILNEKEIERLLLKRPTARPTSASPRDPESRRKFFERKPRRRPE